MKELVQKLKKEGVLRSRNIVEAFLAMDRKNFVLPEHLALAYEDLALPIGEGQSISQPYTVAFMLELLRVKHGDKVLDVGFGSGWTTALLAYLAGNQGRVYALEVVPELFESGRTSVEKTGMVNVEYALRSGFEGWEEQAPFDRILVSAATDKVPGRLKEQLCVGGRIVIPVKHSINLLIKKSAGRFEAEEHFGFAFVPLVR